MRKCLIAAVTMIGASYGVAQAAEVPAANPSIPVQPPPPSDAGPDTGIQTAFVAGDGETFRLVGLMLVA